MSFLLDTDVIIDYLGGNERNINELRKLVAKGLYTSVINLAELLYGVYNSDKPNKHMKILSDFLAGVEILDMNIEVCHLFGKLKAKLKRKGTPVDNFDLLIAGICLANGLTLVTNNIRHFGRIEGLKLLKLKS